MIYDYVQTKPPMEDIIEHGWAKDSAAKFHKYLDRWRGKNGKWVYRYYRTKSKLQGKLAKVRRLKKGAFNPLDEISKDGTVVRRPGLKKSSRSAFERRTALRTSKKHRGKYISSASGGETKKKITTTRINTEYINRRDQAKSARKNAEEISKKKKEQKRKKEKILTAQRIAYRDRRNIR